MSWQLEEVQETVKTPQFSKRGGSSFSSQGIARSGGVGGGAKGSTRCHGGMSFCVHFVKYELILPKHRFVLPNNRADTEKCGFWQFQHFANTSQIEMVTVAFNMLSYGTTWGCGCFVDWKLFYGTRFVLCSVHSDTWLFENGLGMDELEEVWIPARVGLIMVHQWRSPEWELDWIAGPAEYSGQFILVVTYGLHSFLIRHFCTRSRAWLGASGCPGKPLVCSWSSIWGLELSFPLHRPPICTKCFTLPSVKSLLFFQIFYKFIHPWKPDIPYFILLCGCHCERCGFTGSRPLLALISLTATNCKWRTNERNIYKFHGNSGGA